MKLVYVTSSLPYGPSEAFILTELEGLRRRGHSVLLVPVRPRGRVVHGEAESWLAATVARGLWSGEVLGSALAEVARRPGRAGRLLRVLLRSRSPRILLKNLAAFPKGLWLGRQAARWGADHIHAHWAATTATVAMIAGEMSGRPWSFTAHRWDLAENNLLAEKAVSSSFHRCISEGGAQELAALTPAATRPPVVIHMGVALETGGGGEPEGAEGGGRPGLRVMMPANFVEKKGHRYLIEALGLLPGLPAAVTCDLAGSGELEDEIRGLVAAAGVGNRVNFLGMVPHHELLAGLRDGRWQAVVLPSVETAQGEKEGIPVALMEALAAGVPAVSTTTGAIAELLEEGAGVLVPPRDPRALAAALQELAEHPALRAQLARAGRRRIEEAYEIGAVVGQLEAAFAAAVPPAARHARGCPP